ncbi:hypothetical protein DFP72DRAFT_1174028 [Ephemerocybe angulata]|uniref:Uncharacterized protein n=1 Tax=Ephemerocybe angulata TaxID=980116 RepID=A0A8H6HN55_9AGAR|nr:hypothetical protein DFP72DRAFT_1174028 [Tulosesus angulatus]
MNNVISGGGKRTVSGTALYIAAASAFFGGLYFAMKAPPHSVRTEGIGGPAVMGTRDKRQASLAAISAERSRGGMEDAQVVGARDAKNSDIGDVTGEARENAQTPKPRATTKGFY